MKFDSPPFKRICTFFLESDKTGKVTGIKSKKAKIEIQTVTNSNMGKPIIDTISEMAGGRPQVGERPEPQAEASSTGPANFWRDGVIRDAEHMETVLLQTAMQANQEGTTRKR